MVARRIAPLVLFAAALAAPSSGAPAAVSPADIAGSWVGTLSHAGDSAAVALDFAPDTSGRVAVTYTFPSLHFDRVALGAPRLVSEGDSLGVGPFRFAFDRASGELTGVMPAVFFPAYDVAVRLRRGSVPAAAPRPEDGARVQPRWTFAGDSAMWAGPTWAPDAPAGGRGGAVYVGTLAGTLYALDAASGAERWRFRAEGAIRSRPACADGAVFVQTDDGWLYRIDRWHGRLVWKARLVPQDRVRPPAGSPGSRFDRFAADVVVAGDRLFTGTYDGRVVALSAADGRVLWEFATGDAVLAAPALAGGRVYAGSFDHFVYCLEAASGRLVWKHDTRGSVVSTPAIANGRVVVGNRIYDLLGLDAATGAPAWTRYQWGTWVESSASVRDGFAYVGSSDGACASAWDVRDGRRSWLTDVRGWSWGRPAVTDDRVYAAASGQVGYPVDNRGGGFALDRASGAVVWRFAPETPVAPGAWGFPGSVAVGSRFVFASSVEGVVYAFDR